MNCGPVWAFRHRIDGRRPAPGRTGLRRAWLGLIAGLLVAPAAGPAVGGCGGAAYDGSRESAFKASVESSLDEEWGEAASAAFSYLQGVSADDERYDRAMLMLAQALEELGLSHAASLYYLDIAQSRRKVELLDKAVAGLERIVMEGPHDEQTIVRGFLATSDITGLSPERQAFVGYLQGLDSVRQGLDDWADRMFETIPRNSPYHFRARYVRAVQQLAAGRWEPARAALKKLLKSGQIPADMKNEVELALARLAMEQKRYRAATEHYERVRRLAPDRPELLLEMSWAHYYLGDSRRALGLLLALDAPIYSGLIAPERYLLEAFCLRSLCQFEPARTAAVRLRVRHGDALRDLHQGIQPMRSEPLRAGARQRGAVRPLWRFLLQLRREKDLEEGLSFADALHAALDALYSRGMEETERRMEEAMEDEVGELADELIAAEDGVRLILHELGVELLRGRSRPAGLEQVAQAEPGERAGEVSYKFVGEFWTDELDDLVVEIPDRCLE